MANLKLYLSISLSVLFISACAVNVVNVVNSPIADHADSHPSINFMTGTWKAQGAEEFEVWEQESDLSYSGYAYRIKNGEKVIWEKMRVFKQSGVWRLAVRVPEQNEGESVIFILETDPSKEFLFMNEEHDFPKRILYRRNSATEWIADVRGDDNQGFSIVLEKQD